ncbi:type II toxin-antitoxin system RelE/ParE family toxin, partial [Klebsiella pneumoniae]
STSKTPSYTKSVSWQHHPKQDMANINHRELMGFRELAKHYANLSEEKTTALVKSKELVEICDDSKK